MSLSNPKSRSQLLVSHQSQNKFKKLVAKMSEILRVITKK